MGEVYRASDTRLKRQVAIKVLPDALAADPERLARFQREAEVLASLNHPGIAHIYGIEEGPAEAGGDGTPSAGERSGMRRTLRALVMELAEGPTLADRVAQGPIPVDEALAIAKQIAEALEAAHEQGIIHRDLKPANVKVRPDGAVKVLDFGLAKAMEPTGAASSSQSLSPTITTPAMTQAGLILGTAAYMSPEQARGKPVDRRADVWAFGCVLFEMLTGRRAFEGEDVTDTLALVVRGEPAWDALPGPVPARVRQALRSCLRKDVKSRIGDVQSLRLALDGAFESVVRADDGAAGLPAPAWWVPASAAAVVAALVTSLTAWSLWPAAEPRAVNRFTYELPSAQSLRNGASSVMAVSPDGRSFVYNTSDGLYLRRMDELEARLIPGTEEGLRHPFFSPDRQSVAYFVDRVNQLKQIAVNGGAPVVIADVPDGAELGASWEADGTILFGKPEGILRVPATGGTPELVIAAQDGEVFYGPQLLPGGDSVLFSVAGAVAGQLTRWDGAQIVAQSLTSGERTVVRQGGSDARYLPTGHLVFALEGNLLGVGFDARSLRVTGGAVSLVQDIRRATNPNSAGGSANYGVTEDGTLVYTGGLRAVRPSRLVLVDRDGRAEAVADREALYISPRLSPDGGRVAVAVTGQGGNRDIWIIDLVRGTQTRLTTDAVVDNHPLWAPDGVSVTFSSSQLGSAALYRMAADGSGVPEALTEATSNQGATSWSPDGSTLAFYDVGGGYDMFTVKPGETPVRLLETPFVERAPTFSPDGRWLAYSSDETGQTEIYVMPYPGPGGRIAISTAGGRSPRWSGDGRELFFRNGTQMMVVDVEPGPIPGVGTPRLLFDGDFVPEAADQGAHNYDVSSDGQRFLMLAPVANEESDEARPRIVVVQNWIEELKRLVPTD